MEWFVAVVVIVALGVAAVAASGGLGEMSKEPVRDVYRQDLPEDRPLASSDINRLRFGVTLRGYAMGQVDDVLDRLAREIAERDVLIADLQRRAAGAPDGYASGGPAGDAAPLTSTAPDAIDAVVAPHEVATADAVPRSAALSFPGPEADRLSEDELLGEPPADRDADDRHPARAGEVGR